ncbi:MAG TPA: DUF1801 domain-containing protein [Bacteroidia bacterium]|nr:DUF1801 domain-containing protein [Bacteroidia bacterium]
MNPKVNFFFTKAKHWKSEFEQLRSILLECDLDEELKWGVPCYTHQGSNILLIHGFKAYCAILFFKGALLKDPQNMLVQQTKNVQAARQIRFRDIREILENKNHIRAYVQEAIRAEQAGLKVVMKKTSEFDMPQEFEIILKSSATLKKAFTQLSPGRQRAYLLFFSSAKQSATRQSRIEKYIPYILKGKGLND